MELVLAWQGPVGAGRFPDAEAAIEALGAPGVYLRIKTYRNGRTVSYVGQSRNVLARIDQHLTAMLALQTPLRDGAGRTIFAGDAGARFAAYNDLAAASRAAAEEALRTRFYVALCDAAFAPERLDLVEGTLKARLEERVAAGAGLAACENVQGVPRDPFADIARIVQDTGALAAEDSEVVARALGAEPIRVDAVLVGAGHAE
ncbi:MAG: GIY-YIG nuclease family protein [Defluviicoccus sp.]|nr:GIY-YIG nuclease family protein [Defluviicoccus sp.]